jgi:hypothetical protein
MRTHIKKADDKVPILAAIGSVIYFGLIVREFIHFFTRAPWPGYTVAFNRPTLILSTGLWIAGIVALWLPKTVTSRLISVVAVFGTLMHGIVLKLGAAEVSQEGLVYVAFGMILCFVTLDDLAHRTAADGSYLPNQIKPRLPEDVLDDQEPEPPIDEHRLVG